MISQGINKTQERIKKNFEDKDFLELINKGGIAMLYRIGGAAPWFSVNLCDCLLFWC